MYKFETLLKRVEEFRDIAKEIVSNACYGALFAKGFIVDETKIESGIYKTRLNSKFLYKVLICR